MNWVKTYLLSKDTLIASLSYFFPLPPDFRRPLLMTSNFLLVQKWLELGNEWQWSYGDLPKVWKSSFGFSCWWGLIWLLWNKTKVITLSNNATKSASIATIMVWSCIPLSSFPLPLDSPFLALRINPEGECGDKVSFGEDKEGLPLLSTLSPSEGDKDGLLESSALLLHPSLLSPGTSFCPVPG